MPLVLLPMIKRIIDISEAAYVHLKNQQLVIEKQSEIVGQLPIEDLGVLILQHPAIVLIQQFGKIEVFYGKKRQKSIKAPLQLQFF